jgi:hypothetical protein
MPQALPHPTPPPSPSSLSSQVSNGGGNIQPYTMYPLRPVFHHSPHHCYPSHHPKVMEKVSTLGKQYQSYPPFSSSSPFNSRK